ncbi:CPBP family intramembrane metalloprotease [Candidatus Thorarchaeota archaeon]|nr:MAG: CPBP family intramembrane metalloprotease [Candidatus Thorarchaeota archaeon]
METDSGNNKSRINLHEGVSLLLLGILLFMRIVWMGLIGAIVGEFAPEWWFHMYILITIAIISMLILWERNSLTTYHVDLTALVILIPLMMIGSYMATIEIYGGFGYSGFSWRWWIDARILFLPIGLALFLGLLLSCIAKKRAGNLSIREMALVYICNQNRKGLIFGVVVGIVVGLILGTLESMLFPVVRIPISLFEIVTLLMYQLINAAAVEEPVFRGFLWGHLRKRGMKDSHVFIFQALLFWIAHIYYLSVLPLSMFLIVPLGSFILGFIVWRTHSIGASMLTHGLVNTIMQVLHFYSIA